MCQSAAPAGSNPVGRPTAPRVGTPDVGNYSAPPTDNTPRPGNTVATLPAGANSNGTFGPMSNAGIVPLPTPTSYPIQQQGTASVPPMGGSSMPSQHPSGGTGTGPGGTYTFQDQQREREAQALANPQNAPADPGARTSVAAYQNLLGNWAQGRMAARPQTPQMPQGDPRDQMLQNPGTVTGDPRSAITNALMRAQKVR